MPNIIELNLLSNKSIVATMQGYPLANENSYKIIAGDENATQFLIKSKPTEYENATYYVEMVNAKGGGIDKTAIEDDVFTLPKGMAVAGYGFISISCECDITSTTIKGAEITTDYTKISEAEKTYVFTFGSNGWEYNGNVVQLSTYGVVIENDLEITIKEGDKIIVTKEAKPVFQPLKVKVWNTIPQWQDYVDKTANVKVVDGYLILTENGNKYNLGYVQGDKGDKGDTGEKGDTGADGVGIETVTPINVSSYDDGLNVIRVILTDGESYDFTVKNGSKGSTGAQGEKGEKGDKGDKGDTGAQGVQGIQGATGANGKTPVKGVDYFTESDKQEIATEVVALSDLPNYVVNEAESVITRVLDAQGNRTFTFATITDMHYGNGGYTDGVKHAVQAMKYIDERIKLDAVAVLGDYCDSYPAEQYADSIADFKAINKVLTDLRFAPNLRMQGNHDYYADHKPLNRRFIQSYSDNAVWGSKIGGYFYRDFEDFKLRVICVNTTETDNANIAVSTEQYEWFINSLDLTDKDDVAEWQILVLSHHPLDWYVADSVYRFAYILDAYRNGTSWSGGNVSCNFAGKNSAVLIGNIHGHIHNLLTGYLNKGNVVTLNPTEVLRMATPEACINRANQYTGAWKDTETYNKTKGTAEETSFVVYCIDLDTYTIKAICYGAGYDRTVNYTIGAVLKEYSISYNLTNVTSSNSAVSVQEGQAFSTTLTANVAMESVSVTMGGVDITSTAYANGVVNIASVTGNVVITAVGEEEVQIVNLLDTVGYTDGKRFSAANGAEKDETGCMVTGYIDVSRFKSTDKIYAWGVEFNAAKQPKKCVVVSYDTDKTVLKNTYINEGTYISNLICHFDSKGRLVISHNGTPVAKYIRFSGVGSGANAVVTFNQYPID